MLGGDRQLTGEVALRDGIGLVGEAMREGEQVCRGIVRAGTVGHSGSLARPNR